MTGMNAYFNKMGNQKITRWIKTGDESAFAVFARNYTAEVLYTVPESLSVVVHVTSYDVHLTGSRAGGTHRDLGDFEVSNLRDMFGLDDFWSRLLIDVGGEDAAMVRYLKAGRAR